MARAVGVALLGALVLGLVVVLAMGFRRDPKDIKAGSVGKPAAAFDLPLLDGSGRFRLADPLAEGKAVVVFFWATWCLECRREHSTLVRVSERYRGSDVVFVSVLFQDDPQAALEFMRQMGGSWPNVADEGSRTALAYGVYGVPETYFIRPDGVIAGRQVGAIGEDGLIAAIELIRPQARAP